MISNQSYNATQWNREYLYYGDPTVIAFVIILIIVMMLAIGGNILVLATLVRHCGMRTRTNLLLANLAVADIIVAVTDIPFAINTLINGTWPLSHFLCILNAFCVGLGLMVSVQTLMWISVHKFISITRPFSKIVTQAKLMVMIILSWGWCIFYNLTPVMGWTDIIYRRGASQCGPTTPITILQRSHSITNTVFNIVLPFIVMTYCYYHIFGEVRTHMNRLRVFADVDVQNSILQQKRITVTLFIVLACFVLCWTPYIFYSNLIVFRGNKAVPEILNPIAYLFGYMNSACNPIIYALRSPSFRQGFGEIICGPGQMPGIMYAANENKGATIDKLKNSQRFTPQALMGNREIIKSSSNCENNSHNNYNSETNNLATLKKSHESFSDIANISNDTKPQIVRTSSNLSVYDNYPKSMDALYSPSTEKNNINVIDGTESNKDIELMCTSTILCNTKLNHSGDYKKDMNRTRGSLPEVLMKSPNKIKSLKNKNWKNLDITCINKHVPFQKVFMHSASAGDLPNEKYPIEFMQTEFSLTPTLEWKASIEDLIESQLQTPTV